MKITLMYNYNLKNPVLHIKNNKIYIYDNKKKYLLQEVDNLAEINEIHNIIKNNNLSNNYYKIIRTNTNNLTINYDGKQYILLEMNNVIRKDNQKISATGDNSILNRSNWYSLWIKKNKYYNLQLENIISRNPILDGIMDYYIGIAENAIEYLKIYNDTEYNNNVYVSSKRHKENNNPINLIFDCKERELSEKIKIEFFELNQEMNMELILQEIQDYKLSPHRLIARTLYPTYFFDIIDKMENKEKLEKQIKYIVKKSANYEKFLKNMYFSMAKKYQIKNIEWL